MYISISTKKLSDSAMILILTLLFGCEMSSAQQLVPIDNFTGNNIVDIKDYQVDAFGNRYYALTRATGVWMINDHPYDLLEESNKPLPNDQSYLLKIDQSNGVEVMYPGGNKIVMSDSSFTVFYSHANDTVISLDTTLISPWTFPDYYFGSNLSIWNRDLVGNLNWAKIWPTTVISELTPQNFWQFDKSYYLSGLYYSGFGNLIIDSIELFDNNSNDEAFVARITEDLMFSNSMQVVNDKSCHKISTAVEHDRLFGMTSCESDAVDICNIRLFNHSNFSFGSGMPIWFVLNKDLECISARTAAYDYDVVLNNDVLVFQDLNISVGHFWSSYLGIDDDTVFSTTSQSNAFLSIMDQDLNGVRLMTVDQAPGQSSFQSLEKINDSEFLLGGYCRSPRFSIGNIDIDITSDSFVNSGFIALLDTALNVKFVLTVDGYRVDLFRGMDNRFYVYVESKSLGVLYLLDDLSSTQDFQVSQQSQPLWNVHPSPLGTGVPLKVSTVDDGPTIDRISIYDSSGSLRKERSDNKDFISTDGLSAGLYILRVTFSDGMIDSKRIVIIE